MSRPPRRIVRKVRLTPTPADAIGTGDRVRFHYHEPTSTVRLRTRTTCNGKASILFEVREDSTGEVFHVYADPDRTVWSVETIEEGAHTTAGEG